MTLEIIPTTRVQSPTHTVIIMNWAIATVPAEIPGMPTPTNLILQECLTTNMKMSTRTDTCETLTRMGVRTGECRCNVTLERCIHNKMGFVK